MKQLDIRGKEVTVPSALKGKVRVSDEPIPNDKAKRKAKREARRTACEEANQTIQLTQTNNLMKFQRGSTKK